MKLVKKQVSEQAKLQAIRQVKDHFNDQDWPIVEWLVRNQVADLTWGQVGLLVWRHLSIQVSNEIS